jgi:DNA-binding FadR family transcriptional regulator
LRCHEAIAQAIVDQDPSAARHAMSAHFDDTVRVLMNAGVT